MNVQDYYLLGAGLSETGVSDIGEAEQEKGGRPCPHGRCSEEDVKTISEREALTGVVWLWKVGEGAGVPGNGRFRRSPVR
jgi:hypothetical protein